MLYNILIYAILQEILNIVISPNWKALFSKDELLAEEIAKR